MTLVPEDTTPLDPEEAAGLKLSYISSRGELNIVEALNVEDGFQWAYGRARTPDELLELVFLEELHRRMFGDVWKWAGKYRKTDKNIGVPWWQVRTCVIELLADVRAWGAAPAGSAMGPDEIGARYHHRLVAIHAFPNGNGRHGRAAADLLITSLGGERFTWGRENLSDASEVRTRYICALRAADGHDIGPLLEFVRS
ncbi:MAG: cell filamentation protein [Acidimicrobiaceae bacterium]|nr:cell filamentation protein [Acidimicrobiaceae bacterium]